MKRKWGTLVAFCVLGLIAAGCQTNPVTGEREFNVFSVEQQEQIGAEYAKEVEKELGESIKDSRLQNYLDSVGQKIAAVSHTPSEGFVYKAIKDESVNAFALPGGYIYVTTGMLAQLKTEAQLAAIFGHETAHVTLRHSAVGMSRELLISTGLSILVPESQSISYAVGIVRDLEGMSYSRGHERQADEIGLDYLVKAGYTPDGMVETMEILNSQPGGRIFEFLSTHPNPENRIEDIQERIYNKGYTKYKSSGRVGQGEYQSNVSSRLGQ